MARFVYRRCPAFFFFSFERTGPYTHNFYLLHDLLPFCSLGLHICINTYVCMYVRQQQQTPTSSTSLRDAFLLIKSEARARRGGHVRA